METRLRQELIHGDGFTSGAASASRTSRNIRTFNHSTPQDIAASPLTERMRRRLQPGPTAGSEEEEEEEQEGEEQEEGLGQVEEQVEEVEGVQRMEIDSSRSVVEMQRARQREERMSQQKRRAERKLLPFWTCLSHRTRCLFRPGGRPAFQRTSSSAGLLKGEA
ncbi:unnamed protein product [Arctogadus glacialis]